MTTELPTTCGAAVRSSDGLGERSTAWHDKTNNGALCVCVESKQYGKEIICEIKLKDPKRAARTAQIIAAAPEALGACRIELDHMNESVPSFLKEAWGEQCPGYLLEQACKKGGV